MDDGSPDGRLPLVSEGTHRQKPAPAVRQTGVQRMKGPTVDLQRVQFAM